jgi:F-type H+-transporting ATPase subunit b
MKSGARGITFGCKKGASLVENIDKISWLIVHASAFLLLVWLMKKTAWRPILAFLDERRESIARQFQEVENLKAEAQKTQEEYKKQIHQAQAEARDLVTKAKADAVHLAEQMRAEAQAAVEKSRKDAEARIAQETESAKNQLRQYTADLAIAVAEKFLTEGISSEQRRLLAEQTLPEIERAASKN